MIKNGLAVQPNPFYPSTTLSVYMTGGAPAHLVIFDAAGRAVWRSDLKCDSKAGGTVVVAWDGRDRKGRALASGVYLARLFAGEKQLTQKMILSR